MSTLTNIVFPGGTDIRIGQALMALPPVLQAFTNENESLVSAGIQGLITAAVTGWALVVFQPILLPGGSRVRRVQGVIIAASILYQFGQDEVTMLSYSRGLWNGFGLSVVAAHVARFGFFGKDVKDSITYLTNGQALADTPRRINRAVEKGGELKSDAENVSRRAKGSIPV